MGVDDSADNLFLLEWSQIDALMVDLRIAMWSSHTSIAIVKEKGHNMSSKRRVAADNFRT